MKLGDGQLAFIVTVLLLPTGEKPRFSIPRRLSLKLKLTASSPGMRLPTLACMPLRRPLMCASATNSWVLPPQLSIGCDSMPRTSLVATDR